MNEYRLSVTRRAASGAPRAKARGWRSWIFQNSLLVAMALIFLATWVAQSLTNWTLHNEEQRAHGEPTLAWADFVLSSEFWEERTLQNWQSEFLAVGTMAVFTIYLRQRGSPESKPVGTPHDETESG